ncbi:response regulator [Flavihumibacter fluvii]|uniref:response regulator n=1 Tax=Flavihumibacter fluvii TaxID=2838157 RepID=UPI001BDF64F0|nr:response regulator [Flavihumibacter fluvii]ULQ53325.1 response regulator [Flavihumibacter fluvii]
MKKILLIEDNENIRDNTAEILELSGYTVITAEDGKIGVQKALDQKPDLIICDIMMPILDGYGVLHAVQKNDAIKNTPFIFLTAKTERSDFRKGMELGADDYITKPFTGAELLTAVESRLKKHEQLKQELSSGITGTNPTLQPGGGLNALEELIQGRNVNKYKKKQLIYSEGNHPNRLYYLIKGKVKACRYNDEGKGLVTELYSSGDFLGHVALLEGTPYKDTAEVLEDSELTIIPKEEFDELIHKNPEVANKFIRLLASNVSEKEKQLLSLAYNSLRKKVADALLTMLHKFGKPSEDNFIIDINRESLATIAGTATESLIRTLSDFRNEKLVDMVEGGIIILNQKKLETLAN